MGSPRKNWGNANIASRSAAYRKRKAERERKMREALERIVKVGETGSGLRECKCAEHWHGIADIATEALES